MFLDRVVTILCAIIFDYFIFRRFVKSGSKICIISTLLSVASLSAYLYICIKAVEINIIFQLIVLALMIILPVVTYFFLSKNEEGNVKNVEAKIEKYISENNSFEARKLIEKYLDENDEDADTYIYIGKCDKIDGDNESALSNFMKAIRIDKKSYIAYYELGNLLEKEGKIDTAIIMLGNSIKIKPDFYDASELLGICYTSQKKYEEAEKIYKSALKYHETSYELNYNLAVVYLESGNIDEAEDYLVKAASLSNEPYGACYSLGNIYFKRGKYQNAIENYKVSRKSEDLAASSMYKMAVIYCKMREYENAEICLKYSVLIDSNFLKMAKTELAFDKVIDELLNFEDSIAKLKITKNEEEIKMVTLSVLSENDYLSLEKIDVIFR